MGKIVVGIPAKYQLVSIVIVNIEHADVSNLKHSCSSVQLDGDACISVNASLHPRDYPILHLNESVAVESGTPIFFHLHFK